MAVLRLDSYGKPKRISAGRAALESAGQALAMLLAITGILISAFQFCFAVEGSLNARVFATLDCDRVSAPSDCVFLYGAGERET